jgi:pyruvate/2-oxoglutarate dehydrogenase complex dihydrolipoamide dehydrogenase (E3) component
MNQFDYDVAVLGGGSAGYAAARTAAGAGLKTAVIEGGKEVGGLCILRGCMPTKALLYTAEVMHLASHARTWGIRAENVSFDFAKVMARQNALIKDFADYRRQQIAGGKFKFIRANTRFVDSHTVELISPLPACAHPLPVLRGKGVRRTGEGLVSKCANPQILHWRG